MKESKCQTYDALYNEFITNKLYDLTKEDIDPEAMQFIKIIFFSGALAVVHGILDAGVQGKEEFADYHKKLFKEMKAATHQFMKFH
jgi:hypothetical protein